MYIRVYKYIKGKKIYKVIITCLKEEILPNYTKIYIQKNMKGYKFTCKLH